jgi:hypothetical protein
VTYLDFLFVRKDIGYLRPPNRMVTNGRVMLSEVKHLGVAKRPPIGAEILR